MENKSNEGSFMMEELKKILSEAGALPYLFIGSGISRRYIGAPDWINLLKKMSNRLETPFSKYTGLAEREVSPHLRDQKNLFNAEVATHIEKDYNEAFYEQKNLFFRDCYEQNKQQAFLCDNFNPFKNDICRLLDELLFNFNLETNELKDEIKLFKLLSSKNISGVITTNYDKFLEQEIFPDYETIIGNDTILTQNLIGIDELFKIHGCTSNPQNIIINSNDYQMYSKKESYLTAKMLTVFIEHPIVFMGFGMADPNIDNLLLSISNALNDDQISSLQNKFIFINFNSEIDNHNYEISSFTTHNINMLQISISNYSLIYKELLNNSASFSPKVYKLIKNSIFEVIKRNDLTKSIIYLDPEIDENNLENVKAIVGFNLQKLGTEDFSSYGLFSPTSVDLFRDLINNTFKFDQFSPEEIIKVIYNASNDGSFSGPLIKYIPHFSDELDKECWSKMKLEIERRADLNNLISNTLKDRRIQFKTQSIMSLYNDERTPLKKKLENIACLEIDKITLKELEIIVTENLHLLDSDDQNERTSIRRLLRLYDAIKFSENFELIKKPS